MPIGWNCGIQDSRPNIWTRFLHRCWKIIPKCCCSPRVYITRKAFYRVTRAVRDAKLRYPEYNLSTQYVGDRLITQSWPYFNNGSTIRGKQFFMRSFRNCGYEIKDKTKWKCVIHQLHPMYSKRLLELLRARVMPSRLQRCNVLYQIYKLSKTTMHFIIDTTGTNRVFDLQKNIRIVKKHYCSIRFEVLMENELEVIFHKVE